MKSWRARNRWRYGRWRARRAAIPGQRQPLVPMLPTSYKGLANLKVCIEVAPSSHLPLTRLPYLYMAIFQNLLYELLFSRMLAPRSPIIIVAALVLADTKRGITEASITLNPWTPCTCRCGLTTDLSSTPIRHVLVG